MAAQRFGGTRLVGRHYYVREREVEVLTGWGPGAAIRNVKVRFLDTGAITVRPFRGLTRLPRPPGSTKPVYRPIAEAYTGW